jgi:tripartite-type tricarboxylate transporter receptor subunit TctC
MKAMTFKINVLAACLTTGLALAPVSVLGQSWPQRTVRLIVPTGAGSSIDVGARLFGDRLARRWNQPVVVENRPGAEGVVGVTAFVNMHDDHALLVSFAGPMSVLPIIQEKLPYDPAADFVPISSVSSNFATIAATASLNISSLSELVAMARAQSGKLNYHAAPGAFPILFAGFMKKTGIEMVSVAYRESILSTQDLVEGRIQVVMTPLTNVLPQTQTGKLRLLAVTNKERSPLAPAVPTAIEAGFPDLAFEGFSGFFGTRGITAELRDRISADIRAVASDPTIVERLAAAGLAVHASTPTEFAAAIVEQRAHITSIVKLIGHNPAR